MKYLSLFSGIGGFELGIKQAYENNLHRKGMERPIGDGLQPEGNLSDSVCEGKGEYGGERPDCIGYSEIDKYATQIYQSHFKDHKNYGDITKINEKELPDFDLLVGGFPCQSFSIAGKRKGFLDTRGTLFFDIVRILKVKIPRRLLLENVKGLLSHANGDTFRTILSTLDELGYDLQWQVLNSKNFGVPQNRERVFIIGHLRGTPRPEVFPVGESDKQTYSDIKIVGNTNNCGRGERGRVYSVDGGMTTLTSTDYKQPKQILQLNNPIHSSDRVYGADGISPTLRSDKGGSSNKSVLIPEATKKGYAEATVGQSINLSVPNSKTRRGRVSDMAQTLDTGMQQHTLTEDMKIRRLTPVETERLQGFPDNWTEGVSDSQRYKCCGNAVTVNVIQYLIGKILG